MGIDIRHQGVAEHDLDIKVGDARISGYGDRRADQAGARANIFWHIGRGVGGAVDTLTGRRVHTGT